ncbi:nitroreductase family protein [Aquamicrobium zhengzhouense]|uniref:Putative NAD(P)H nitroreductase n=1 Tax=Aquamicrobium zhengzhouense TaxID=2781738 RepID=A0ABS0S7J4_9HYPH|nr:nitroreductase [Aquamicrobium zhengzhouense]MBI1619259.1 nitroreductase [Aquamicrobium zhengzhouense]
MSTSVIEFLLNRSSAPIAELKEPAPSGDEIKTILTAASRVPDHGRLAPWRFIIYRGDARIQVGEKLLELAVQREPDLSEARQQQERSRFSRAPLVIGVVSVPREHPKVPQWEMLLSGGAAAMKLCLAANALGYSTNWITNWYSDDAEGRRILGLAPEERVVGFIHIGTYEGEKPQRRRPDIDTIVTEYSGPHED